MRLTITETGLYYLDASSIAAEWSGESEASVEQRIQDTNLVVSSQYRDVFWYPAAEFTGIYFYAVSTNNRYSSDNYYWVTGGAGDRMSELSGSAPSPGNTNIAYDVTARHEQATWAWPSIFFDADDEFWVWDYFWGAGTKSFPFPLDALATATGTVRVAFRGASNLPLVDPEHSAAVYLNGVLIGSNTWDGVGTWTLDTPVSNLQPGANTLRIDAHRLPNLGPSDFPYYTFDWFEVSRQRFYVAVSNTMTAYSPSNRVVTAHGFAAASIEVFDVSDFAQPVRLQAITVDAPSGSFRASFNAQAGKSYFASATSAAKTPAAVTGRSPADLRSTTNRAMHVTIAAPGFESTCETLAAYRRGQGMEAKVVKIEDVFDEFSAGLFTPWAIRSFLQYAVANWTVAPKYVVLAGSGSYDYKDYQGNGDCQIPAAQAAAGLYGLRNSDAPLADWSGGTAPEIAIGRLHCQTVAELAGAIAKIQAFEAGDGWAKKVQFNAGITDPGAGNFSNSCNSAATLVGPGFSVDKNYAGTQTVSEINTRLKNAFYDDAYMICYYGHGNPDTWGYNSADEFMTKAGDLASFNNATSPPLLVAMTCDFADFGAPGAERLGEGLIARAAGGAGGLWGCVGPTFNDLSTALGQYFLTEVFDERAERVGDAVLGATEEYEASGKAPYLLTMLAYHGDPAMILPAGPGPTYALLSGIAAVSRDGVTRLEWDTAVELGTIGFIVERLGDDGQYHRLTPDAILAMAGGPYHVVDPHAALGDVVTYRLTEIENTGAHNVLGPYELTVLSPYQHWQATVFKSPSTDAAPDADADGDGHSNYEEFLAGTDPADPSNVLRVVWVGLQEGHPVVAWQSSPGRTYLVERAATPGTPFATITSVDADSDTCSYRDEAAEFGALYRIRLSR